MKFIIFKWNCTYKEIGEHNLLKKYRVYGLWISYFVRIVLYKKRLE